MPEFGQNQERVKARLSASVNAERDRRIAAGFEFLGHRFDFDPDSVRNITGAGASAGIAMAMGTIAGNLRWADADTDFGWLSQDNAFVPMDAQTCFAFSQAARSHTQAHIFAARRIKDQDRVPDDFTDDKYWP